MLIPERDVPGIRRLGRRTTKGVSRYPGFGIAIGLCGSKLLDDFNNQTRVLQQQQKRPMTGQQRHCNATSHPTSSQGATKKIDKTQSTFKCFN
jgi:hypothetical protein